MKSHELLQGNSSAYIATATAKGYTVKVRIKRGSRSTPDTYQAEIKVMAKGERWMQCHWFNCNDTVDEVLAVIASKFDHIAFEKDIKLFAYKGKRKAATKAKKHYIKVAPTVGMPTTVETSKPLFTFEN